MLSDEFTMGKKRTRGRIFCRAIGSLFFVAMLEVLALSCNSNDSKRLPPWGSGAGNDTGFYLKQLYDHELARLDSLNEVLKTAKLFNEWAIKGLKNKIDLLSKESPSYDTYLKMKSCLDELTNQLASVGVSYPASVDSVYRYGAAIKLPVIVKNSNNTGNATSTDFTISLNIEEYQNNNSFEFTENLNDLITERNIGSSVIPDVYAKELALPKFKSNQEVNYKAKDIVSAGLMNCYIAGAGLTSNYSYPVIDLTRNNMKWQVDSDAGTTPNKVIKITMNKYSLSKLLSGKEELLMLYEAIPKKLLLEFNYDKIVDIDLLEDRLDGDSDIKSTTDLKSFLFAKLPQLEKEDFGDFILFDVFSEVEAHGLKVADVVKQVLRVNHLDFVMDKIQQVPVNYLQVQEFGDSIIEKWCTLTKSEDVDKSKKTISPEKREALKNDYHKAPLTYLQALFEWYSSLRPDIISSSFNIRSSDVFVLRAFKPNNDCTSYLSAALNELNTYADDYTQLVTEPGKPDLFFEPINSFLKNKNKYGVILVGNQIADGQFKCTESRNGSTIDVLGNGINWGMDSCTKYIHKSDCGTSFATPEVATLLFIAKAVWRHNKKNVNAVEARTRLLLSTNLNSSFVNKFSSAGTVNLQKLIESKGGYLVTLKDSVYSIDSVIAASMKHDLTDELRDYSYRFSKETGRNNIRGVYLINGRTFVFNKNADNWKEVNFPDDMVISIFNKGEEKTFLLKEFKDNFKQFVLL
jgi:hypothetical protein